MTQLPAKPGGDADESAGRRLSSEQFELVIRRATEIQAQTEDGSVEGLSEAEVLRIGKELGLSGSHMQRALAEVRGRTQQPAGPLDRWMGAGAVQAGRTVPMDADRVRALLEAHLVQREYFEVQRRFPDRLVLVEASGVGATVGRAMSQAFERRPRLRVANLEIAVQPLEEGFAYVSLSTTLATQRTSYAAGGVLGGGLGGAAAGVVFAIAIAPPAALIGLPILGISALGARWAYRNDLERTQQQLESLLDRLEHGELPPPPPRRPGARG